MHDSVIVKVRVRQGQNDINIEHIYIYICARTAAISWRGTDGKNEQNHPNMPLQTNMRVLMYCFALSLHPHACMLLVFVPCRESVIVCVNVCLRVAVVQVLLSGEPCCR